MGRKSYTIEEKIEILRKLRLNEGNVSKVSRETQIPSKCIRTWRDEEDKLLESFSKRTSRKIGAGRKPKFPQLELELKDWLTIERRENKRIISYNNLREKALQLSEQLGFTFDASDGWITSFMNRNGFSCRKITSIGQEDNLSTSERKAIVTDYFKTLEYKMNEIEDSCIFNMDETPIYIDMMNSRTISFKGEKNTEVHTTGYQKTKITVVITISLTGEMLRTFVILKGLKKVPKCYVPSNIQVAVSNSGMMDNFLMKQWITNVYNREGPFIKKT